MKKIYTYVLNTLADWEIGLAIAELNTQRFFDEPIDFEVKTFALTKDPIKTMGGITILPDFELSEVNIDKAALLILPGAEEWTDYRHEPVLELAANFLKADVPVAAICGATEALARIGMLNNLEHTSNGLEFLKMTCPGYTGEHLYRDELAVTDGNLITAGSSSAVAFAYHILQKLNVMKPEKLTYWNGYFEKHSLEDIMRLIR
jgi:putative intracellular protease/amidase